jgi:pantetheine-phosphate adenylyltransferase
MSKAVYPGTFDPITLGHIDVIRRSAKVFSDLTVLIAHSPDKNHFFSLAERKAQVVEALKEFKQVKIDTFEGLTVDYVQSHGGNVIIRGIRMVSDFEYEMAMANTNHKLNSKIETMIVLTSPEVSYISSKHVKEVNHFGGDIRAFVPACVHEAFQKKKES